jgi:spore coat protein U-like protein
MTKYARFVTSAPGEIIADSTTDTGGSLENFTIRHRVQSSSSQAAGNYSATIIYIVTAEY